MEMAQTPDDAHNSEATLRALGLSPNACRCYLVLMSYTPSPLQASEIATHAKQKPSSTYRALRELTTKGFVREHRLVGANRYWAEPLTDALDNYALYQRQLARPLLRLQRRQEQE